MSREAGSWARVPGTLRAGMFRRLCRARDMLREVPVEAVGVADITNALELSPFHFIRQFEAVFGRTPHPYRIESRLERARGLLAGGTRAGAGCGRPGGTLHRRRGEVAHAVRVPASAYAPR